MKTHIFEVLKQGICFAFCISFLTGCLGSKSGSSDSSSANPSSITSVAQSVSSQSALDVCNNGKEGALVYDRSQGTFYVCDSGHWTTVNLQGAQGTQGPQGATGPAGANGTSGTNGTNGTNGADGNGMGLVLRDGSSVIKGWFMGFVEGMHAALLRLPNGDMIYIDVPTGKFTGGVATVYYSGTGCTGDAYVWPGSSSGTHVIGRIYSQSSGVFTGTYNVDGSPIRFFRATDWVDSSISYNSRRIYHETQSNVDLCTNGSGTINNSNIKMKAVEISAPSSLESLAPITFGL